MATAFAATAAWAQTTILIWEQVKGKFEQLSGKITEAYYDYQKTLQLEPKFAPAAEHLKDFVVTKAPAGAKPPG